MRIVLKLPDGAEEIRDIEGIAILLDDWPVEISPDTDSRRITFHVPSRENEFCNFVVHHRSANTMCLEIQVVGRDDKLTTDPNPDLNHLK